MYCLYFSFFISNTIKSLFVFSSNSILEASAIISSFGFDKLDNAVFEAARNLLDVGMS